MIHDILGQSGMVWFTGVVEDRNDPLHVGRVRVRCFGYHTHETEYVPTESLPWASIMLPVTDTAMNGIGTTPSGLVEGSWVVGFFTDGSDAQHPVVMGCIPGRPTDSASSDTSYGFHDPNGVYPLEKYLNEPDVNRLARGDSALDSTDIPVVKEEDRKLKIPIANLKDSVVDPENPRKRNYWDEPEIPYAAQYPYNHVYQSESGHVVEFDDTTGAERIHEYHKSGTFREIHPTGDTVIKIKGSKYTIIATDDNVHVSGNVNITVDGNTNLYTKKNLVAETDGNVFFTTDGNVRFTSLGNVTFDTTGATKILSGRAINITSETANVNITSSAQTNIVSGGRTSVEAAGKCTVTASGIDMLASSGNVIISAPTGKVRLNGATEHAVVK